LNYTLREDTRGIQFAEAGFYRDSSGHLAKIAGLGYQYKLARRWRLGGAMLAAQSRTYNDGGIFVAPVPILTYDLGGAKLNAIYLPAAFGFYLTLPLSQ
jgi:hypothetical protein